MGFTKEGPLLVDSHQIGASRRVSVALRAIACSVFVTCLLALTLDGVPSALSSCHHRLFSGSQAAVQWSPCADADEDGLECTDIS